jgi:hypothetical protein
MVHSIWTSERRVRPFSNLKFAVGAAMKYDRFEDLPVWRTAAVLAFQIFV